MAVLIVLRLLMPWLPAETVATADTAATSEAVVTSKAEATAGVTVTTGVEATAEAVATADTAATAEAEATTGATVTTEAVAMADGEDKVYVIRVAGMIDNGLNMYVDRGITAAENGEDVVGVILHMDTFGGLVDAADNIRKRLLDAEVPVVTFIDPNAASAGALISFGSEAIFMAPGGSIGAATVVDGSGEKASEKMQSYMRGLMRSTAEARGYDPRIAEAMVDERIEIEGVIAEGQLLTLSAAEALDLGLSSATLPSVRDVAAHLGWEDAELFDIDERWEESAVRFFASPVLQSLLMLMMLGGLYFELQSPGVGFAGAIAGLGALLFFLPLYIMGLAQSWEILIVILGVGLIAVEIFALPGFGVFGVTGAVLVLFGLFASLVGNVGFEFPTVEQMRAELWTITLTLVLGMVVIATTIRYVMKTPVFGRLVLTRSTDKASGYTSSENRDDLMGREGVTLTSLRLSGTARIGDRRVDVVSDGDFIEQGARVKVIATDAGRVVVTRLKE